MAKKAATPPAPAAKKYVKQKTTWASEVPNHAWTLVKYLTSVANRYRWQLTPAATTMVIVVAGELPGAVVTAVSMAVMSGILFAAQRTSVSIRGRMFLSARERETAALWTSGAALWSGSALLPLPIWAEVVTLLAITAYPDYRWLVSRKPVRPKKLSQLAMSRLALWEEVASRGMKEPVEEGADPAVARGGQHPLAGSKVIRSTVREPAPGELVFMVQLRDDVHGKSAANEACQYLVEAVIKLPSDCCLLEHQRNDSTKLKVTLSPERHLEQGIVPWPGPEIFDGDIPIARRSDGTDVTVRAWDKDGVYHGRIGGTSGGGKSTDSRVIISALISTGYYSVWMIDGGYGQSLPEMKNCFDLYATEPRRWRDAIDAAYAVMVDRQRRRGAAGLSGWYTGTEKDPNIMLWTDESPEVARQLGDPYHKKVLSMLQNGRKCGVSVVQLGQDPFGPNLLGGAPARRRMARGFEILHRPGDDLEQKRTQASGETGVKIDLLSLPTEPGFAGVQFEGKIIAQVCRVRYPTNDQIKAWAETVTPRSLTGADLTAAGKPYARRDVPIEQDLDDGEDILAQLVETGVNEDSIIRHFEETEDEQELDVRSWLIKTLRVQGPAQLDELEMRGNGVRGRKRRNLSTNLARLLDEGLVTQDGAAWQVPGEEDLRIPTQEDLDEQAVDGTISE